MRVAVVDIGSNSIKLLVAARAPDGRLLEVRSRALEVRISRGIGSAEPRLEVEGMKQGIAAIAALVAEARGLGAAAIVAVATSAVRDASNGAEFRDRTRSATGLELRILTGLEEANFIGRGLMTDPALAGLGDFDVFDLGGGSLECLSFRGRAVERAVSLPLGCVRMTERFVPDPTAPFGGATARAIRQHVRDALLGSGFPLPVPPGAAVVGTGGTLATVRAMVGEERAAPLVPGHPLIEVAQLRRTLARVEILDLAARRRMPGLPAARADVFPAALATLLALAEVGAFESFHYSLHNLRWGVAAECLG